MSKLIHRKPTTMLAGVIAEPRQVEIRRVPIPEPGEGQLRIMMEGCGVCASNIPPWEGRPWFSYPMEPGAPGHEGWGWVDAVGASVNDFTPGDRIAILSSHAYAQYDIADASATLKLPPTLNDDPFPAEPLGCAMNIIARSGIQQGNTVVILGIGFLGALLCRLATNAGARVIAISRRSYSLKFAREMGASDTVVLNDSQSVVREVQRATGGTLCDVVIEATGKQEPLDLAAELVRERGRLLIAGYHQDGLRHVNMQLWNWRGFDVINAHERDPAVYLEGMRMAVNAVQCGQLDPMPLYTHHFPIERLGDALKQASARPDGFMKAVVVMHP